MGYEKNRNSSTAYGATMFINFDTDLGSEWNDKFAITPYYRFYFLESQDYGGYGVFAEIFTKFSSAKVENYSNLKRKSYTDISPGLAVGRKWINRKGFTFELMFGVGASIVIIGALLKITHSDFIFSGNTWLTAGLITEAIIFSISGIQGFMTGDSSVEDPGLQTIEAETQSLQQAVDQTVSGLSSLNKNLTAATAATESFSVPNDINENLNSYNDNLSSAASKLTSINELYDSLNKSLSEVNSSTSSMNIPDGLGEELTKMKATINELNSKYSSMLEGMNK